MLIMTMVMAMMLVVTMMVVTMTMTMVPIVTAILMVMVQMMKEVPSPTKHMPCPHLLLPIRFVGRREFIEEFPIHLHERLQHIVH